MKSYRKELWFNTPTRRAIINITPLVEECLRDSGIREGLLLCNAMHITASVFINDDEPGLHDDFERWLERLAPERPYHQYRHNDTGEDNADAHLKREILGRGVVVAVTSGSWILVHGNKSFMPSLMVNDRSEYLSRSLGNRQVLYFCAGEIKRYYSDELHFIGTRC